MHPSFMLELAKAREVDLIRTAEKRRLAALVQDGRSNRAVGVSKVLSALAAKSANKIQNWSRMLRIASQEAG